MGRIKLPDDKPAKPKRAYVRKAKVKALTFAEGIKAMNDAPRDLRPLMPRVREKTESDLRLECLSLALMGSAANLGANYVIERAQEFVAYVQNGPPGAKPPTLDDRLTQAFLAVGESLNPDD